MKQQDLTPYGMIFRSASLYVSENLSKQILEFFDGCFEVEDLHACLDMNRDYSRLLANEETGLGGADLELHRTSAEEQVIQARSNLMTRLTQITALGLEIEAKFVKEIKLS